MSMSKRETEKFQTARGVPQQNKPTELKKAGEDEVSVLILSPRNKDLGWL